MYWTVVPLLPPPRREIQPSEADDDSMGLAPSKLALTEWIRVPPDDVTPEPGVHYRVNTNFLVSNGDYVIYPETEALATFRHC